MQKLNAPRTLRTDIEIYLFAKDDEARRRQRTVEAEKNMFAFVCLSQTHYLCYISIILLVAVGVEEEKSLLLPRKGYCKSIFGLYF